MKTTTLVKSIVAGPGARVAAGTLILASLLAGLSGCTKTEAEVPKAEVKTVEAYGVTLDPDASPQQVTYVLLKSIADDYAAARAKDLDAQKKAQAVTMSVAAPGKIEQRLVATANQINPKLNKKDLGPERDEKIFKTVHYWAPIVGHYTASFGDADLQTVVRESWVTITLDGETAHVFYPVAHDPSQTDPEQAQTATISVELVREAAQAGGAKYWRVGRVEFLGRQFRAPSTPQVVQAYGMTLDDSAGPAQVASAMLRTLADMATAEKAGAADERASALNRAFALSHPAQVHARAAATRPAEAGDADDAVTRSLAQAVFGWAEQVRQIPAALSDSASLEPGRMQESAEGNAARVVYSPEQRADAGQKLVVDLVRQAAGGKTFWRVVNVSEAATGGSQGQPAPTTQAAGPN